MKNQKSRIKNQKLSGGFTLLESMIAIAVFTVGVSTAMVVITSSISVGTHTKNKIIAANLAQEGIEVVRNIRDRNWMAGRNWTEGLWNRSLGAGLANACVQWDSEYNTILPPTDPACVGGGNLVFLGVPPHYAHGAVSGQFSRTVSTQLENENSPDPNNPERLLVSATAQCGQNCSITLSEYLYDWK